MTKGDSNNIITNNHIRHGGLHIFIIFIFFLDRSMTFDWRRYRPAVKKHNVLLYGCFILPTYATRRKHRHYKDVRMTRRTYVIHARLLPMFYATIAQNRRRCRIFLYGLDNNNDRPLEVHASAIFTVRVGATTVISVLSIEKCPKEIIIMINICSRAYQQ